MPVRIEVTQQDIDVARARGTHCPITRAICRAYGIDPNHEVVGTSHESVEIDTPETVEIPLSPEAQQFTRSFDKGEAVGPFSFELAVEKLPDIAMVR